MAQLHKKNSLRRCSLCYKAWHNKARCERDAETTIINKPRSSSLRLFVHHVNEHSTPSPYVVDLKQNQKNHYLPSFSSPAQEHTLYHSYHKLPKTNFNYKPNDLFFTTSEITKETPLSAKKIHKPFLQFSALNLAQWVNKRWQNFVSLKNIKISKHILGMVKNIISFYPHKLQKIFYYFWNRVTRSFAELRNRPTISVAVILIALIISLPISARGYYENVASTAELIAKESLLGFDSLLLSIKKLQTANLAEASSANEKALGHLSAATNILAKNHRVLQNVVSSLPMVGNNFEGAQRLLVAGEALSIANSYLLHGALAAGATNALPLTERLNIFLKAGNDAAPLYQTAIKNFEKFDPGMLPLKQQAEFNSALILLKKASHDLTETTNLAEPLNEIFGGKGLRRYLLIFQNSNEIRPTGGFMGSFALLEVKDGKIIKLDVPPGGTYDLKGQLDTYLQPPTPLSISNKRWEFQDANWFPNFPTSAEKILWFYRHSRGITTDGVIAINASVLERLLEVTGPVTDSNRNITLSTSTAIDTIQRTVEEMSQEKIAHKPKQILSDLAPQFIQLLKNLPPTKLVPLTTSLASALDKKEIQLYFTDKAAEDALVKFGWSGSILPIKQTQDYLFVVNTNIQGGKSDSAIHQNISHEAVVASDGTITDTVIVTRQHDGGSENSLSNQTNINYIRLYVPEGSKLISASGFTWPNEQFFRAPESWYVKDDFLLNTENEIYIDESSGTRVTNEFGKYAFGNWVITEPNTTSQVQFTYVLPFKAFEKTKLTPGLKTIFNAQKTENGYQLVAQKQSGVESAFESQVVLPEEWRTKWFEGDNIIPAKNGIRIANISLEQDAIWSFVFNKN